MKRLLLALVLLLSPTVVAAQTIVSGSTTCPTAPQISGVNLGALCIASDNSIWVWTGSWTKFVTFSGSNAQLVSIGILDVAGTSAPSLSAAGAGRIYFDSTANVFKFSVNGGAFGQFGGPCSTANALPKLGGCSLLTDDGTKITLSSGALRLPDGASTAPSLANSTGKTGLWFSGEAVEISANSGNVMEVTNTLVTLASGVNLKMNSGYADVKNIAAPGNPATTYARLYVSDNGGAGNCLLVAKLQDGTTTTIATLKAAACP